MTEAIRLKRTISTPVLIFYGVGTMVGGGFYALVGKVAGIAGLHAPFCMLAAGLLALLSALSFAELSSRYPVSAGESAYVERAFGVRWISVLVGWMVITTGVVSAATLANAVVLFLQDQYDLHRGIGIFVTVAALGLVAAWGIGESLVLTVVITVIEVGGLLYVLFVGRQGFVEAVARPGELLPGLSFDTWSAIGLGGFLVFYGYLGFEDMVNIAEEVKRPRRSLPVAILWSLGLTTLLYCLVSMVAVLTLSPDSLAKSLNPLADVVEATGSRGRTFMGLIAVLAGVNGALVQIIMASRVAYGMSDQGLGPRPLAVVHPWTRTPLRATGLVSALILALALWFPLLTLAQATSSIILVVFAVVNLALVRITFRERAADQVPATPAEGPRLPWIVPMLGFLSCVAFLTFRLLSAL